MKNKKLTRREFLKGGLAAALLAGAGGLAGCIAPAAPPEEEAPLPGSANDSQAVCSEDLGEVSLRILWTGDTHGHLRPIYHREFYGQSFLQAYGIEPGSPEAYLCSRENYLELAKQYGKVGGYAHLATLIQQERSALPDRTLLLDSGDAWYGSAIALLTQGRAPVEVMNAIGYDALTLHWEFNLGKDALLQRIEEAQFAVLVQNLVDTDFEDRVLQPSLVREINGLRVAVVGQAYPLSLLTTEDPNANPGFRMGYRDVELQQEIDRLRQEEGVSLVVLLSHMGYEQDKVMAARLNGVDVIVGGHTHDILWRPEKVGQTILLQGGSHGKFLGELDLEIQNGQITACRHRLIPVVAGRIEPDPEIAALIDELYAPYEDQLQRVIGETKTVLYRRSLFGGTTDAFVTRAYREIVGADLGCASGWRFGATILPGEIRVEDVYNAMKPTPTPLYKARLVGRTIRAIMEDNLDNVFNPDPLLKLGGDVTRCDGMQADLDRNAERDRRTSNLRVNGETFDPERIYTVATSGGRTQYRDPNFEATAKPAVEELVAYIQASSEPIDTQPVRVYSE